MSSAIIIDPDGDIVLRLQQEQQSSEEVLPENTVEKLLDTLELTVSSKVLSLASPVFKVMISGKFKEGIEMAEKRAASESYILTLHDDDVEAAIILARVLHFNLGDLREKPSTACLEKLAFLCDKYQCSSAIKYCGGLWIRNWLLVSEGKGTSIDDLCRLLIFAYVIDLPYEFGAIAWRLFLQHKGPFLGPSTQVGLLVNHALLRQDVARELNMARSQCCQLFHRGLMAPLNLTWKTLSQYCHCAAKTVGCYINSLGSLKIMPLDLEFTEHTFRELLEKVSKLPYISTAKYLCGTARCACYSESAHNLSSELQSEVKLITERQKTFICLDCLKADKRSHEGSKCRISYT